MSDLAWVQIRSWHIVSLWSDRAGHTRTLCGRSIGDIGHAARIVDDLPAGKSCEACLRIAVRLTDKPDEPIA